MKPINLKQIYSMIFYHMIFYQFLSVISHLTFTQPGLNFEGFKV